MNPRPHPPQGCALARLRYTPIFKIWHYSKRKQRKSLILADRQYREILRILRFLESMCEFVKVACVWDSYQTNLLRNKIFFDKIIFQTFWINCIAKRIKAFYVCVFWRIFERVLIGFYPKAPHHRGIIRAKF